MIRQIRALCLLACGVTLASCSMQASYLNQSEFGSDFVVSQQHQSLNHNQRIRMVVLHYTTGDWAQSLQVLTTPSENPVSAHYLIPERSDASYPATEPLKVYQLVSEQQRAWHAGMSFWQGQQNLNDQSIGIELVNRSRCVDEVMPLCFTPDFDPAQLELLAQLLKDILARHPEISPTHIVGHSDISPQRKQDPGPRFPWQWLARQGIGAWYDEATVEKYWQQLPESVPLLSIQQALRAYGYGIAVTGEFDEQTTLYLRAFQQHFVPDLVSGNPDRKTLAILFALVEKYQPQELPSLLRGRIKQGQLDIN